MKKWIWQASCKANAEAMWPAHAGPWAVMQQGNTSEAIVYDSMDDALDSISKRSQVVFAARYDQDYLYLAKPNGEWLAIKFEGQKELM